MKSLIDTINTADGKFHGRNIQTGELATIFTPVYANDNQDALRSTQRELLSVLSAADIKPDVTLNNQLLTALKTLLITSDNLRVKNALQADENLDDVSDKSKACKNLGLKNAAFRDVGTEINTVAAGDDPRFLASAPVGSPLLWLSDIPPGGYAIMQGQLFDDKKYPILARLFPLGFLPDWRGQTPKGKPAGREVMSFEEDGIKSHAHTGTVSPTDLGRKTTNPFDYGSKPTTAFDYGNKGTDAPGDHVHNWGNGMQKSGGSDQPVGGNQAANFGTTSPSGNHAHVVYIGAHDHWVGIGAHDHFIDMGAHGHAVIINAFGNKENTVKNIAVNFIVRLA